MIIANWIADREREALIRENVTHMSEIINTRCTYGQLSLSLFSITNVVTLHKVERAEEKEGLEASVVKLRKKMEGLQALVDELHKKVELLIEVSRPSASSDTSGSSGA